MREKDGFTMVELIIGIVITLIVLTGILGVFNYYSSAQERSNNFFLAMNAARAEVEQIRNTDFDLVLIGNSTFDPNGEDDNLNGVLDGGEDENNNGILDSPFDGSGRIEVTDIVDSDNNLKDVRVVVCWRDRDGRIIGEDNGRGGGIVLDGVLQPGEDTDGDSEMDSPCVIETAISRKY